MITVHDKAERYLALLELGEKLHTRLKRFPSSKQDNPVYKSLRLLLGEVTDKLQAMDEKIETNQKINMTLANEHLQKIAKAMGAE